ncbi:uncharacterized protein LOC142356154 [Convolutriloba macropyga]|uniref:uncharacterized protein LOC142356154 n=1 Tax=Convolutriloba macropyga TaxID=536237 RepID=UPI003F52012A
MKMAAQTGHSRRADLTPISIFVLLYHVLRSSSAFNPIDPDHSRFNFANVHLELHPESITNNIWPKEFDRVGKYCQDSGVGPAQGKLCIPKYEEPTSFRNGCDASEYRVCDKYNGSIAMVERGGCTMSEKAKAAEEHSITGLIIIETLNVSNPSDLQGYDGVYGNRQQNYNTTYLDHSVANITGRNEATIPFILCTKATGNVLESFVKNDTNFAMKISDGGVWPPQVDKPQPESGFSFFFALGELYVVFGAAAVVGFLLSFAHVSNRNEGCGGEPTAV